ncbi:MAG: 5'-nucleotidase C-terminal domain-containing protein [Anaerolineae bacterium]
MRVTNYHTCDNTIRPFKRCDGITASGLPVQVGVAACGRAYPFGTVFEIPDVGLVACYDRGGGVGNSLIDVWMPDGTSLFREGSRWLDVTVRSDIDPNDVLNGLITVDGSANRLAALTGGTGLGKAASADDTAAADAAPDADVTTAQVAPQAAASAAQPAPFASADDSTAVGMLMAPATQVDFAESALGNLAADILRSQYQVQIGLINSAGLNASLPAGTVRLGQLVTAFGPTQKPITLDLRGDDLKAIIEYSLSQVNQDSGAWLHMSGLRLTYNPSAPPGQRIVRLTRSDTGEQIWENAWYHIALTDSLYLHPGFTPLFERGRGFLTYEPMASMAAKWLANRGAASPHVDGRVTISR